MQNNPLLQATKLACRRQQKLIFADISLKMGQGELLLIEGPNGSGKSSLLRLLAGFATPFQGEITWQGKSIQSHESDYHQYIHYLSHTNGCKLGLTVLENLRLASKLSTANKLINTESVLSLLQLTAYQHTPVSDLSAGQKRRVALAKLFLFPKSLWLLDEPLTALDVATQELFLSLLKTHLQKGGIGVISSHHAIQLNGISMQTVKLNALC